MNFSTLLGFSTLFAGRPEAYFDSDNNRTAYYYQKGKRHLRALSLETFREHLYGKHSIGTYPVLDDSSCRWSCIDIDEENLEKAKDVKAVWNFFKVPCWIERSRSKGYHVWVFTEHWESASLLRKAGLYVAEIAEIPGVEVNPKNFAPWNVDKFINTVRLPYANRAKPGRMVVLDDDEEPLTVDAFVSAAMAHRASKDALLRISKRYEAMEQARKIKAIQEANAIASKGNLPSSNKSTQEAYAILEGTRDIGNGERDNQFFTLANVLKSADTELDLALRTVARIYENQCLDKTGFTVEDALSKVRRVYGG